MDPAKAAAALHFAIHCVNLRLATYKHRSRAYRHAEAYKETLIALREEQLLRTRA
jgi:hypothetical protein